MHYKYVWRGLEEMFEFAHLHWKPLPINKLAAAFLLPCNAGEVWRFNSCGHNCQLFHFFITCACFRMSPEAGTDTKPITITSFQSMKKLELLTLCAAIAMAALAGCSQGRNEVTKSGLRPADFETEYEDSLRGRKPVSLHVLKNGSGMEACITNFGGRIVSLTVPDRDGGFRDVVLGFSKASDYFPSNNQSDFGAAIGRYANRIDKGSFVIDGERIQLPVNNFGHCLHGGPAGWQYQVYDAAQPNDSTLILTMHSPDGDQNFPGEVTAVVTYTLRDDNALDIKYSATSTEPTVINMTNHSYFNLSGDPSRPVTDHLLYIDADSFTPVDSTYMTTGEILPVEGTPMDFRTPKLIGRDIDDFGYEQLKNGNGYDHNWVLNGGGDISVKAAELSCPESGIALEVYTTEPGLQFYSGNFLDGTQTGKNGKVYGKRAAACLETQHYPDSPNKPDWPSVVLRPGESYESETIFKFTIR